MPTAWDITILETLELLDGQLSEFAAGLCDNRYAVWLGAGISMGKLPGLHRVAKDVLEYVRTRINPTNPACAFRVSMDAMLNLVMLSPEQRLEADYAQPVETWPVADIVAGQLVNQYSIMLNQAPASERPDYLIWDGIGLVDRYANPAITPGAEHLGLAALIMEGVASDSASANWDDLIEKAARCLNGPATPALQVRVLPADVQQNDRPARLYKFHGCAALAGQNEPAYRDRIVGRAPQVNGWANKPENAVIANKLVDLAVSKATLMLGLSTQDANIQDIFVKANVLLPADFPTHPPWVIVSEEAVGAHQRSLLENFYRNDYPTQSVAINAASLAQAYAQALLPALWLHVICAKLSAMIARAAPDLPDAHHVLLQEGLQRLRNRAAGEAVWEHYEEFMLAALERAGRAVKLFRHGRPPTAAEGIYTPITNVALTRALNDPNLNADGVVQLALGLALLGYGEVQGHWSCATSDPTDAKTGAIVVSNKAASAEVFFAGSAHAAVELVSRGHVADGDDAVLIHSFEIPERAARSPTAAPGRTGRIALREFSLSSLADGAVSLETLLGQFKAEMAL